MKKYIIPTLLLGLLLCISNNAYTQSSDKISYQAVVHDATNKLLSNANISTRISLLLGSAEGSRVYAETHATRTNTQGLMSISIGDGQVLNGEFGAIDWSKPYFIKVEID
ncbi:MAG: hypothetical protein RSA02_01265, partial [Bacteroidales bacterium]